MMSTIDAPAGQSRRQFLRSATLAAAALAISPKTISASVPAPAASSPMAAGRPSATAQGAAVLRAAHQLLDEPTVLTDPLALRIIGSEAEAALTSSPEKFDRSRSLRAYVVLRSRYAEDLLAAAVAEGVDQYVLLGAGLDTFAYRNPHPRLRVFEVDHPATQRWKRQRLEHAGIAIPGLLRFAPVDFETETLAEGLRRAGFNAGEPAFFSMLGVAVYLTKPALMGTLAFVASCAAGSEIVFSYGVAADLLTEAQRQARANAGKRVAALGEPWISYFHPQALADEVAELGFSTVRDLDPREANARYFRDRADGLRVTGSSRLMSARV